MKNLRRGTSIGLVVLAGSLLLAATGLVALPRAEAQKPIKIRYSHTTFFDFYNVPIFIAQELGFFKEEGVEVEDVYFRAPADQIRATAAHEVSVGSGTAASTTVAIAKGLKIKMIAVGSTVPAMQQLMVLPDSPLQDLSRDLKGKKIGISSRGAASEWVGVLLAKKYGLEVGKTLQLIPLGKPETLIAAMMKKELDGAVLWAPSSALFQVQHKGRTLAGTADLVHPAPVDELFFATEDTIKNNPDGIRKLLRGYYRGVRYMKQNRAYTQEVLKKRFELTPEVGQVLYEQVVPIFSDTGEFRVEGLTAAAQMVLDLNLLDKLPPTESLYTTQFVPVAAR